MNVEFSEYRNSQKQEQQHKTTEWKFRKQKPP
jgi:hypothetical protein